MRLPLSSSSLSLLVLFAVGGLAFEEVHHERVARSAGGGWLGKRLENSRKDRGCHGERQPS